MIGHRVHRGVQLLAAVGCLPGLLTLIAAIKWSVAFVGTRITSEPYRLASLGGGITLFVAAVVAIGSIGLALLVINGRGHAAWLAALVPTSLVLLSIVPTALGEAFERPAFEMTWLAQTAASNLGSWTRSRGQLPANPDEWNAALGEPSEWLSPYSDGARRLHVAVIIERSRDAIAPAAPPWPPGTTIIARSPDEEVARVTATSLSHAWHGPSGMLLDESGGPRIITISAAP